MTINIIVAEMRLKALNMRTKSLEIDNRKYSASEVARILTNFANKLEAVPIMTPVLLRPLPQVVKKGSEIRHPLHWSIKND